LARQEMAACVISAAQAGRRRQGENAEQAIISVVAYMLMLIPDRGKRGLLERDMLQVPASRRLPLAHARPGLLIRTHEEQIMMYE